ncbi:hypothetical protein MMA231_04014 (plasmid) [Asticcacaulis sp. MM231]
MNKSFVGKLVTAVFLVVFFVYMFANANFPTFSEKFGLYTFWGLIGIWFIIYLALSNLGYFDWFNKRK